MKVRLLKDIVRATRAGTQFHPFNAVIDVPAEESKSMIEAGTAEAFGRKRKPRGQVEVEIADAAPGIEVRG